MRRRPRSILIVALVLACLASAWQATPAEGAPFLDELSQRTDLVPGQVVIGLDRDTGKAQQGEIVARHGLGVISRGKPESAHTLVLSAPVGSEIETAARLAKEPGILYAEPVYIVRIHLVPNDDRYDDQWAMPKINMPDAWHLSTGVSSVIVAVLDTGLDMGHPDAPLNVIVGYDFANGDADPSDDHGHGTHVAGTIAANTDNTIGVAGVAWDTTVMPIKVADANGNGTTVEVADGINYAVDHGAHIINMSLGTDVYCATLHAAVDYAYSHGVALVASAGNDYDDGNDPEYPAALDHVLAVAATGATDEHASYSNTGAYVDIAAPGGNPSAGSWILSTDWRGNLREYVYMAGTSMAAPHVAGALALAKHLYPAETVDELYERACDSAVDLGAPGWDEVYGWGRLDVWAALTHNQPTPTPTPTATNSPTATDTPLPTATDTLAPTATDTPLPTSTNTPAPTATDATLPTSTDTPVPTSTDTPNPTATETPLPTATETPVPTSTDTPIPTSTDTPTPTVTDTPLPTVTGTPLPTVTGTPVPPTATATDTGYPEPTSTEMLEPTATETPIPTSTETLFPTETSARTSTPTSSFTPTPTYAVGGPQPDTYEPDDTLLQASAIVLGAAPSHHTLHQVGDVDWARFTVNAPSQVVIQASPSIASGDDTLLSLRNAAGSLITQDDDTGPGNGSRIATWLAAGTYHAVASEDGGDATIDAYTLFARGPRVDPWLNMYGPASGGWTDFDTFPRHLADVNGDGLDDIVAFGNKASYVSLATGGGFGGPVPWILGYGVAAGGWTSQDTFPRMLADVNGDGRSDIVGFGNRATYVSLSTGASFQPAQPWIYGYGVAAGGWASQDLFPRCLADVNGDGRADIIGFGNRATYVSLSSGASFQPAQPWIYGYGVAAGGWTSNDTYPRALADVNGDGRADIVAFGNKATYVSLSTGSAFGPIQAWIGSYGPSAGGWATQNGTPRMMGDVDGDGLDDIVGFASTAVVMSRSTGSGFAPGAIWVYSYGPQAGGWSSQNVFPRMVGNVGSDGADSRRADIVGIGNKSVYVTLAD